MNEPINTYISFKPVTRLPNNVTTLATGTSSAGATYVVGVQESNGEGDRPALYLKMFPEDGSGAVLLRCDFSRLVDSVIGATAAEMDAWTPLRQDQANPTLWGNFQVTVAVVKGTLDDGTGYAQISYHRRDRAPIRDWRIGQRIKNELCGPEWEAIELYPADSRVVDTANEYYMWAIEGQFPFGFEKGERATQAQIDEAHIDVGGDGEGPMQRDDPTADTSNFFGPDVANPVRVPTGSVSSEGHEPL
jgi:hypothetical protein